MYLFSNESDAIVYQINKQKQNLKTKIIPIELDKVLIDPNCIIGEILNI
jgi:hypothetical protein